MRIIHTIHSCPQREKRSKKEKKTYEYDDLFWVTFLNCLTGGRGGWAAIKKSPCHQLPVSQEKKTPLNGWTVGQPEKRQESWAARRQDS